MPTARRLFTASLIDALCERNVAVHYVTLHTGLPGARHRVRAQSENDALTVPAEEYALPADTARAVNATKRQGGTVLAVGTTVVRTLETAGRDGLPLRAAQGWTSLCVSPGHRFQVVDALVTNFHSPDSSHIQLAAALAGDDLVTAGYAEANRRSLRFDAFGDITLTLPD
jgi:S-adenosylmethionine:tRNA ribosyltransferase-isomerase